MTLDKDALSNLRIERSQERTVTHRPMLPWILAALVPLGIGGWYFAARDSSLEVRTVSPVISGGAAASGAVLNASGYVVARRQATVSAKITGKVAAVLVEEGMLVTEGQLLARLDDSTAKPANALAKRQMAAANVRLEENRVRLAEAERALQRTEKLRADKLVSEAQLDAALSEVAALRARLAALLSEVSVAEGILKVRKQELDDLLVRAPFTGIVISKDAQPGEIISPVSAGGGFTRTGIATIVDMDSREIELDVNEAFINRVKPDQKTQAILDAYPDWVIPSHVINIVPAADRQKATVRVRIGFDELDARILPDMGIKVTFLGDATRSEIQQVRVRVPTSTIESSGNSRYVWRVTDGKAERIAVRVGTDGNGETEILSGIESSDLLIAEPAIAKPRENAAVRVKAE